MNSDQLQQEESKTLSEETLNVTTEETTQESKVSLDETNSEDDSTSTEAATEGTVEVEEVPKIDYTQCSKVELVNALQLIVNSDDLLKRRNEIEEIRSAFFAIRKDEIEKEKALFEETKEEGESEIVDFRPIQDPYEGDIKRLTNEFHKLRLENVRELEATRSRNLASRIEIIEQIKSLPQSKESFSKTFQLFKELQQKFHEVGSVPQGNSRSLWDSYHHANEVFYDFVDIDRGLRDLDFAKNLEAKTNLCLLAEKLGTNEDIIDAFYRLQNLHEKWREIGHVSIKDRDVIWKRFSEASTIVNGRHHKYFEEIRAKQDEILKQKDQMCVEAENISKGTFESIRDYRSAADKLLVIQKTWKALGPIHRKEGRLVWERFRAINDEFFERKRAEEDRSQEVYNENYDKKVILCEKAEALSVSDDWKTISLRLIQLQKDWKKIGPVPRRKSDKVWVRFRSACDLFFNRKQAHYEKLGEGEQENLIKKENLIKEVEAFETSGDVKVDLTKLKEFQDRWHAIGFVPIKKKEELVLLFRKVINANYSKVNVDEAEKNIIRLKIQLDDMAAMPDGKRKIFSERDHLMKRHKQFENDRATAENNIGFFTGNKNNPLLKSIHDKVENIQKQMDIISEKVAVIDEMLAQFN